MGRLPGRSDLLALISHDVLNENEIREAKIANLLAAGRLIEIDGYDPNWIDPQFAIAYSVDDLARAVRDLEETRHCLQLLSYYLAVEPLHGSEIQEDHTQRQADIFEELNRSRLFREAWASKKRSGDRLQTMPDAPPPLGQSGEP